MQVSAINIGEKYYKEIRRKFMRALDTWWGVWEVRRGVGGEEGGLGL